MKNGAAVSSHWGKSARPGGTICVSWTLRMGVLSCPPDQCWPDQCWDSRPLIEFISCSVRAGTQLSRTDGIPSALCLLFPVHCLPWDRGNEICSHFTSQCHICARRPQMCHQSAFLSRSYLIQSVSSSTSSICESCDIAHQHYRTALLTDCVALGIRLLGQSRSA